MLILAVPAFGISHKIKHHHHYRPHDVEYVSFVNEDEEGFNEVLAKDIGIETFGQFPKFSNAEMKAVISTKLNDKPVKKAEPVKPVKKEITTHERLEKMNEKNE